MKRINIFLLFLTYINLYSQNGYIEYGYIEAFGIGNAQGPEYNAYLTFDKGNSYYVTAKDSLETVEKINAQQTFNNTEGEVAGAIYNGLKSSKEGDQVFFSSKNNQMYSSFFYNKIDFINDGIININWDISTKEKKKIGNFNCIKATTSFRGRSYITWFTPDIAAKFGPWKLNGLPGLILEAYDKEKYVYWYFKNIEYPKSNSSVNVKNPKIKYIEYSEFKKFQLNELQKEKEKSLIFSKQYPNVEITTPKLIEMFIECE